jgi:hypothetical protein
MKQPDIVVALDAVIGCFEKLGIVYYIGGSVASSAYGIARAGCEIVFWQLCGNGILQVPVSLPLAALIHRG